MTHEFLPDWQSCSHLSFQIRLQLCALVQNSRLAAIADLDITSAYRVCFSPHLENPEFHLSYQ